MPQCPLFVRYCTMDGIIEDFLAIIIIKGHTRDCDFMDALKEFAKKYCIPVSKLISVYTDSCPSMVGANNGLISLMKGEGIYLICCPFTACCIKKLWHVQLK